MNTLVQRPSYTPTPWCVSAQFSMFLRWGALFIQLRYASDADDCPHAMVSPPVLKRIPAAASRAQGS